MLMLNVADSCFKAGPVYGFGLLLFCHQPPFISVVGYLSPPQGSSRQSRYSLSQILGCCPPGLVTVARHCCAQGGHRHGTSSLLFLTRLVLGSWCSETVLLTLALASLKLGHAIDVRWQGSLLGTEVSPPAPALVKLLRMGLDRERDTTHICKSEIQVILSLEATLSVERGNIIQEGDRVPLGAGQLLLPTWGDSPDGSITTTCSADVGNAAPQRGGQCNTWVNPSSLRTM